MQDASRDDLLEEFLSTSGQMPGLAEHLCEQRSEDEALHSERQAALAAFDGALGKYPGAADYLDEQRSIERRKAAQEPQGA